MTSRVLRPTSKEAVQWLYFGYLAAVKEQNGAAMSVGRTSTFLDIYAQRDLRRRHPTPRQQVQEIIDHLVMKLRMVKFARTPEYNELFSGDPHLGHRVRRRHGHGRPLTWSPRTSFRYLHTLENLGPAPEPNLTVLWSTAPARELQALLRQDLHRHLLHPVRERRPDAR